MKCRRKWERFISYCGRRKIISTCTQTETGNDVEDITNLEEYINTSFYKTLGDKIKDEVQNVN